MMKTKGGAGSRAGRKRTGGPYRILAFWLKPPPRTRISLDAWIPALSPSCALRERLAAGLISWGEFVKSYRSELRAPSSQNLLKPLALLSLRRAVRVICPRRFAARLRIGDGKSGRLAAACPCPQDGCMAEILADVIKSIRMRGRFHLSPEENGWFDPMPAGQRPAEPEGKRNDWIRLRRIGR